MGIGSWQERNNRESDISIPMHVYIIDHQIVDWIRWSRDVWVNYRGLVLATTVKAAKDLVEAAHAVKPPHPRR